MPNHVTTVCTITGPEADISRFVAMHLPAFEFDEIIPKPEVLRGTVAGSLAELGLCALRGIHAMENTILGPTPTIEDFLLGYGMVPGHVRTQAALKTWLEENHPAALVQGALAAEAHDETGYTDWYSWCIAKWGTKWSAYDIEVRERTFERQVFKFETAWSFPVPIFEKLALHYPALSFDIVSFDEGWCFALEGGFGRGHSGVREVECTEEMHVRVYGCRSDADDEAEAAS